jgi:hypothetical protein
MVYLTEHIKSLKTSLSNSNLATLAYYYVRDKEKLGQVNPNNFEGQELISAKGYLGLILTEHEQQQINKPAYKGVDISSTIFKLIGAYLAVPSLLQKKLEQKFKETTFRNQFLISRCISDFRSQFVKNVENDSSEESWVYRVIEGLTAIDKIEFAKIGAYLEGASDVVDLIVLEELFQALIQQQTPQTIINNKSVYDTVISILNNFHNALKKITQARRKDHLSFEINDEYDVQDILYVILKSLFPNLKDEDPTPKIGAKSNKIDLILREDAILIEVKMIKKSDSNEKTFIEELKNDIQSYRKSQWLRHLVFFVYDPFGKTKDVHNFYDLNGQQTINETTFSVEVILNPK